MIEGILFELTLIIMRRSGSSQISVLEPTCPAVEQMIELNRKYSVPGFRVYVTCAPYMETRCDRVAMAMSGVNKEACRDDW